MQEKHDPTEKSLQKPIAKLLKDYPVEPIRTALINHWAVTNGIALANLERGKATGPFLEPTDSKATEEISNLLRKSHPKISIKGLESAFESFIDIELRKSTGAVYTPNFIIDYLVKHGIAIGWHHRKKLPHICDPACGSGGFIIRSAEILQRQENISVEKSFAECIAGIDVDPWAIKHSQCLIELYLASQRKRLPGPELRLYCLDTLLSKPEDIWAITGFHEGFDVLATNPPYVRLQNLDVEYRDQLLNRYSGFAIGSFSLALLFLVAGHRLLAPEGCLAMITQNNLYTSLAGRKVRQYLQENRCIRRIVDFSHYRVFREVRAYTCLVFLGAKPSNEFEFKSLSKGISPSILNKASFSYIKFGYLKADKWRLAEGQHLGNLKRLESIGRPLGTVTSIKVGFATLKDTVFFVRETGDHCIASPWPGSSFPIESGITRPAVKVSDLSSAKDLRHNNRRIIFPYKKVNGQYYLMCEDSLESQYPKTYEYLCKCRHLLESRDKGKKVYKSWYAWGRTQGMDAPGPKLLTKTFSSRAQFFLDTRDQLFCNGYAIFVQRDTSLFGSILPIEALGRILNSKVMHYYAKLTSFQIGGDYQCYQKNFIERFGIVDMTSKQIIELLELPTSEIDNYLAEIYELPMAQIDEILK